MKKECCAWCRNSLADNFCCAPTCKCHKEEVTLEKETLADNWNEDMGHNEGLYPETPTPKTVEDWEEKFNETFPDGLYDCLPDGEVYFGEPVSEFEAVKEFIRQTLLAQNQAADERLREVVKEERQRALSIFKRMLVNEGTSAEMYQEFKGKLNS